MLKRFSMGAAAVLAAVTLVGCGSSSAPVSSDSTSTGVAEAAPEIRDIFLALPADEQATWCTEFIAEPDVTVSRFDGIHGPQIALAASVSEGDIKAASMLVFSGMCMS